MATETTYTHARAHFASLCDRVASHRDVVIIRRRGAEDVALVSAAELSSLAETAHLLLSPRNAARLQKALVRARGRVLTPEPLEKVRREMGLDREV
jgi:antitoxin YefM